MCKSGVRLGDRNRVCCAQCPDLVNGEAGRAGNSVQADRPTVFRCSKSAVLNARTDGQRLCAIASMRDVQRLFKQVQAGIGYLLGGRNRLAVLCSVNGAIAGAAAVGLIACVRAVNKYLDSNVGEIIRLILTVDVQLYAILYV